MSALAKLSVSAPATVVGTYICDDCMQLDCPDLHTVASYNERGICYHQSTARRLEWQHGHARVDAADIARWNRLGRRA